MDRRQYREEYLNSEHWHITRLAALERAGHRCQVCNGADRLDVHHRTYERLGNERPEDLTVLCRRCHDLFHDAKQAQTATPKAKPKKKPKTVAPRQPGVAEKLLAILDEAGVPLSHRQVAARAGMRPGNVASVLDAMRRAGQVRRLGGKGARSWTRRLPGDYRGLPGFTEPTKRPKQRAKEKARAAAAAAENERLHRIQQANKLKQQAVRDGRASPTVRADLAGRYRQ